MDKLIINFPPNEGVHKKLTNISNLTEVCSYYPMYCYAFIIMISDCCRHLNQNSSTWCSNQISCFAEGGFCLPLKEVCLEMLILIYQMSDCDWSGFLWVVTSVVHQLIPWMYSWSVNADYSQLLRFIRARCISTWKMPLH